MEPTTWDPYQDLYVTAATVMHRLDELASDTNRLSPETGSARIMDAAQTLRCSMVLGPDTTE